MIATVAVVLLLAGCAGSNDTKAHEATDSPAPTSAPTTTSAKPMSSPATPVVLTRAEAATKYLELIKASNAVFAEPKCTAAEEFLVEGGTWPPSGHSEYGEHADQVLRGCHKRLVPLYEMSLKAFQTIHWPADARADMADLILQDQAFLYCLKKTSKATGSTAMYKALQCFPEDDGSADRVRARFGLPGRSTS
jgi:hypothetical protein